MNQEENIFSGIEWKLLITVTVSTYQLTHKSSGVIEQDITPSSDSKKMNGIMRQLCGSCSTGAHDAS